jgi:hypothetical protein
MQASTTSTTTVSAARQRTCSSLCTRYAVAAPITTMLNLLIAFISDSFDKMKEKEGAQFLRERERASLLAEYQIMLEMLPFVARWADMNPKYIHVLKPADDLSAR